MLITSGNNNNSIILNSYNIAEAMLIDFTNFTGKFHNKIHESSFTNYYLKEASE